MSRFLSSRRSRASLRSEPKTIANYHRVYSFQLRATRLRSSCVDLPELFEIRKTYLRIRKRLAKSFPARLCMQMKPRRVPGRRNERFDAGLKMAPRCRLTVSPRVPRLPEFRSSNVFRLLAISRISRFPNQQTPLPEEDLVERTNERTRIRGIEDRSGNDVERTRFPGC